MMTKIEMGRTPTVFVSSTCYDLKQVRADIREFISEQLGFEAILSEYDSFPLEPEISAVENCIRAVKQRADIFCLIIGSRYGSVADSGKSITNLEYINARGKGIPIYVFVSKDIIANLPFWEKNKSADYSGIVDSPQLFEFVAELRGKENVWTFGFDNAKDIITTFRKQIGYLFFDSLNIRSKIYINKLPLSVQRQEGKALKIIIEKPEAWEHLLLGEIFEQAIARNAELKRDLIYGFSFGKIIEKTEANEILEFINLKTNEMIAFSENFRILFDEVLPDALGAPGEPGNEEKIIYVGEKFGALYEFLLRWGLEFLSLSVKEEWKGVINALSKLWESPVSDIDAYMDKYKKNMKEAILHIDDYKISESSTLPKTVDLTLTLKEPNLDEFYVELEKLEKAIGITRH